jgi:hypothetical protein
MRIWDLRSHTPSDWKESTEDLSLNIVVFFTSPDDTATVSVKFFPRDGDSLKKMGDGLKADKNYKISQFYRNATTTLAGLPAVRTLGIYFNPVSIYEDALGYQSSTDKLLMVWTLAKEKDGFFGILYRTDKSSFPDFLPDAEQMINSFEILKTNRVISED